VPELRTAAVKALAREETQTSMKRAAPSSAEAGAGKEVEASESNGVADTAFNVCRRFIARWKTSGHWKQCRRLLRRCTCAYVGNQIKDCGRGLDTAPGKEAKRHCSSQVRHP
jgi:hypothetical protein